MWLYLIMLVGLVVMAYRNLRQQGHTKRFEAWLLALDVRMQLDEDEEE